MRQFRIWLIRLLLREIAETYYFAVDRQGLKWTLELIDEDVETYGGQFIHTLAKAGCIDYAERKGLVQDYCNNCMRTVTVFRDTRGVLFCRECDQIN